MRTPLNVPSFFVEWSLRNNTNKFDNSVGLSVDLALYHDLVGKIDKR